MFKFCVEGGLSTAEFRWTIIGSQSTNYTSYHGMQGNIQEGGTCLRVIDIPKYPYYPQYITIKVYSPTIGPDFIIYKHLKIVDRDKDDPTCEEYYNLSFKEPLIPVNKESHLKVNSDSQLVSKVILFDILGRVVYSGKAMDLDLRLLDYDGILLKASLNRYDQVINTDKILLVD